VHGACEGTLNSIAAALSPYPTEVCTVGELGSDDIYCLAEPSGLGAPYFRGDLGITFSGPVEGLSPRRIALLLQEGIIFRVARILEDMHREFGIERAFLSGGLSRRPCLQQGIARCAPCDCYRLSGADAGLVGVARAAAGEAGGVAAGAEKIGLSPDTVHLPEKYVRWKDWMDGMLAVPPVRAD
jgi:glycerol kinase